MRGGKLRQQKLPFLRTPVRSTERKTDTVEGVGGAASNFSSSSSTPTVGQSVGYERTDGTNIVGDEK